MLKNKTLTYISLFSCAGVGCYGFKQEGYHCIATNEINPRRLNVQIVNDKCEYASGYIAGDISFSVTKNAILKEMEMWHRLGNDRVDVVVATPPCQGISVINHKKNSNEIKRNSLIVESIELIKEIRPRFFIFENVMAFQKTLCTTPSGDLIPIGDYISSELGEDYVIASEIMNFMNYGSNSSRTRTVLIGVDKAYRDFIAPQDLFPKYRPEKTLREVIGSMPKLKWGAICPTDFFHAFRTYDASMRPWIHGLKEGESAFDNANPKKRPHRIINGELVENKRKTRDKYTRQLWDRFPQCIHTRNDQLAAQNTIHPVEDRVFSIRELMKLMTVPDHFKWMNSSLEELNKLSLKEKQALYKEHEVNIRQCLGEAVPTEIMRQIAANIASTLLTSGKNYQISQIIVANDLNNRSNLMDFIKENPNQLPLVSLQRIAESCNAQKELNAAYYTSKFLASEMAKRLPIIGKDEIRILEPSVGAGNFLPFLFRKYADVPSVHLCLVDIDRDALDVLNLLLEKMEVPSNFTIEKRCADFLETEFDEKFDLVIGNPPFCKIDKNTEGAKKQKSKNFNQVTNNLSEYFLEKCIELGDYVALVLNKNILSSPEYEKTRDLLSNMRITHIVDFGRYGFSGVSIETIGLFLSPKLRPREVEVTNIKRNMHIAQKQNYITDSKFPYFIIYRDEDFDKVANKLTFDIFDVYRDRQISKSNTTSVESDKTIWVLKARNLDEDGQGISHIKGYDRFISANDIESFSVSKYFNDVSVYLTPNMTYKPRVFKNKKNVLFDGSIAVLIPKRAFTLSEKQLRYFTTHEYREFYKVARNLSTQSINIDKASVYFFGALNDC